MKILKNMKNRLDERQEQTMLKIEHNGFWIAFWGLFASLIIQGFLYGPESKYFAGESVVFTIMSIYITVACIRHGIWDRHLKPDPKTNAFVSLAAAGSVFAIRIFYDLRRYDFSDVLLGSIFTAIIAFLLCFISLSLSSMIYRRVQKKFEADSEEPFDERDSE